MTIEKKGATKQSAEETDKAIRKFVLDNPIMTGMQSIIDKIDKLKKQGDLPVKKKSKGGGADSGEVRKRAKSPQARKKMPTNDPSKLPAGLKKDTTTSAYGDAGRGRPVPKFKEGGVCRGVGAAIKGTNFKGVF